MDTSTGPRPVPPQVVADPALVRAILADPGYTVPDPGSGAPARTMHWLRQNVARFSNGTAHARRRELAEGLLRPLDPDRLRAAARDQTSAVIDEAGRRPFEVMARVARRVPGLVLAAALGCTDPEGLIGHLAPVAAVYQPGPTDPRTADGSVARLAELLPGGPDEQVAARIGLLIQAYDATAGLIGNAVVAGIRAGRPAPAAELVAQALRADPPARLTRRVAPSGETIAVDLTVAGDDPAGHLAFGHGPRICPGATHAIALAEGAVQPLLARCRGTGAAIRYPGPAALRAPERLELAER
jgi:cytochrome P450